MACSIQRKTDSLAPSISTPSGEVVLRNSFLFGRDYAFIHELNLKINTSQLDRFETLDFVCTVKINGVETSHPTTFTWHRKYCCMYTCVFQACNVSTCKYCKYCHPRQHACSILHVPVLHPTAHPVICICALNRYSTLLYFQQYEGKKTVNPSLCICTLYI